MIYAYQAGFTVDARHAEMLRHFVTQYMECFDGGESRRQELLAAYENNAQFTFCMERLDTRNNASKFGDK
jgi:hypothetical protein